MLKTIALILLAALALLLIVAATRPDSFRVERSITVQASPERLYALINDLKQFNRWNPYEKKDPAIKGSYGQTLAGPGARYAWESKEVGVGSLEIVESQPAMRVAMKLDFISPFDAHNMAEFNIEPVAAQAGSGQASKVTWAMHGPANFISKLMGLVFNMDRMVGSDFEAGLLNLKALAEQP